MDGMEMNNQVKEAAEGPAANRFNQVVAVSVALVAVFMALCNVKDGNIVQAMMQAQAQELDSWNHYQAKSIKQHLYELQISQWKLQSRVGTLSPSGRSQVESQLKEWDKEVKHYDKDESDLKGKAEGARREYDRLNFRDDQFDLSDAMLGLAIALFATASLAQNRNLYGLGAAFAFGGIVMGLAGFFGWPIHPGVIRFLT